MNKRLLIVLLLIVVLLFCACNPSKAVQTNEPEVTAATTPEPTPEPTLEPTPEPTFYEATQLFGLYEPLSVEKTEELRKQSIAFIKLFFEGGFDDRTSELVKWTNDGIEYRDLGIMPAAIESNLGQAIDCQAWLLGGDIRDGFAVLFLGCRNKNSEKVVFPVRMPSYHDTLVKCVGDEYTSFKNSCEYSEITQSIEFYHFIVQSINNSVIVQVSLGPSPSYEVYVAFDSVFLVLFLINQLKNHVA